MIIEGRTIRPEEGYEYVTNGTSFSKLVMLGANASADDWHDTNDQPPVDEEEERRRKEQEDFERQRPPTAEERMEAQLLYTALMTETLLEEG